MTDEKLNMRDETLSIRTRLERVALTADIASHYVQDMRVMPASGVARVAWDAMDHIDQMETALRESALSELSALGQATEAYDAQKAAEAEAASWKMAVTEAELECKALRPKIAELEADRDTLFRKASLAEEWRDSDRQRAIDAEAKLAQAVEEKLDAISTLDAWFDRRKLGHDAVDQAVIDAASGYLRTSRSGGMASEESDMILGVIQDMARLGLFADLFARAAIAAIKGEANDA